MPTVSRWTRRARPSSPSRTCCGMAARRAPIESSERGDAAGRRRRIDARRLSRFLALLEIAPQERVRGAVVRERGRVGRLELADDAFGQHLAELDAPLIERIDVPDHAL